MDIVQSVKNRHINDADKRTRDFMRQHYPKMLEALEKFEQEHGDISNILGYNPNPASAVYIAVVTFIVNEGANEPPAT